MTDRYAPDAAPILAGMVDELAQFIHDLGVGVHRPRSGPSFLMHQGRTWKACPAAWCLALRQKALTALADGPEPSAEILEPRRIESPWHGDDDEPWHVTVKES